METVARIKERRTIQKFWKVTLSDVMEFLRKKKKQRKKEKETYQKMKVIF